ncbi:5'-nucleotidase C-terminal domain-containing protein [Faecalibacter bovis]|uniref:5'-nucleotidase C-terminal domain-containing protein n=1 Tax=Faecalibacter bovis TaxID=2898187 RepID=A0ABX7XCE3_9FLAO|nr:5'-nucleotidase C-terminal domain-containing protein [Faecalibacter bovis]QTV05462.1 5'-nucleotidase C-terminal domain-containing protein [Faecalibacter bovis]
MKLFKNNILAISMILLTSCSSSYLQLAPQYKPNTTINSDIESDQEIVSIINPYKEELKAKMDRVLAYSPIDLHKNGYSSPLCNLVADVTFESIQDIYTKQNKGKIDAILLNHGGIRRTFTAGNLTVGNVFELAPFDNEILVLDLKGETIKEMVDFYFKQTVAHPVAGITATSTEDIKIGGQPLDLNKVYKVVTSDYLSTGGDNMFFFTKALNKDILNIKQRDILLDYFEKIDTVQVNTNKRIYN